MSLDIMFSGVTCAHCGVTRGKKSFNITHNLVDMARECGIYKPLWRPEENGIETAAQLLDAIKHGIEELDKRPGHYRMFSSTNGWGTYEDFVVFCHDVAEHCGDVPDAKVTVSR